MRRLCLLAFLPLLALVAPAHAAPEHAEIAFVRDGAIWASRADGSEPRVLVAGDNLAEPAWSPDGSRLAYVSGTDDASRLMLDDRPLTPLRKDVNDHSPAWSPGGTALVFSRFSARDERYSTSIVVRDLASGAERVVVTQRLFPRFNAVSEPAWSPDAGTIAYTHSRIDREGDVRPEIRTVPAAGGASTLLIRDAQAPAWSPDGSRLAFAGVRDRSGKICTSDECWFAGEIYTAAADGTGLTRLTRNQGDDAGPRWSPDGSRILFTSDRNQPSRGGLYTDAEEVYSVAADGSCLTWLTNGTPASAGATWRPGSGSRFDPGSCDPAIRAPVVDPPRLPSRPGLWLGPSYRGLLATGFQNGFLSYDDCERFEGCRGRIDLVPHRACRSRDYSGLRSYRLLRVHGALVAYNSRYAAVLVYSGETVTSVDLGGGGLKAARRAVRALRPYDRLEPVRRLAAPRLPRAVARRLGVRRYVPC